LSGVVPFLIPNFYLFLPFFFLSWYFPSVPSFPAPKYNWDTACQVSISGVESMPPLQARTIFYGLRTLYPLKAVLQEKLARHFSSFMVDFCTSCPLPLLRTVRLPQNNEDIRPSLTQILSSSWRVPFSSDFVGLHGVSLCARMFLRLLFVFPFFNRVATPSRFRSPRFQGTSFASRLSFFEGLVATMPATSDTSW